MRSSIVNSHAQLLVRDKPSVGWAGQRTIAWSKTLLEGVEAAQQAARAGSRLRVTNSRLDRCRRQGLCRRSIDRRFVRGAQCSERSAGLHGVTKRRARAVQLQTDHGVGRDASLTQRCSEHILRRW